MSSLPVEPKAQISSNASIHETVKIWAGSQIRENVSISKGTSIGQYVYVGPGVQIGSNCKIQNQALIYEPAILEDGVFVGPRVVITNDVHPRAVTPQMNRKVESDWIAEAAHVGQGASLSAGVICVGPIRIGRFSLAAAGAVVTRDIPDFALVAGIPAKQIGWVGRAGYKLLEKDGNFICPETGEVYALDENGQLFIHLEAISM